MHNITSVQLFLNVDSDSLRVLVDVEGEERCAVFEEEEHLTEFYEGMYRAMPHFPTWFDAAVHVLTNGDLEHHLYQMTR